MKLTYRLLLVLILSGLVFSSCSESDSNSNSNVDPTKSLIKISEGLSVDAGMRVEVWSASQFFAGYNQLYIRLRDIENNRVINDAHILLNPIMTMSGGMTHACPFENPEIEEAVNGLFPASVFFTMPSSDMDSWKLTVGVHNHKAEQWGEVVFNVAVNAPESTCMSSFIANDTKYFVSYFFPSKVKVGMNDFTTVAYTKKTMMEFPPAEDLDFVLTPIMPAMEHGSPNNVNPLHTSGAFYEGKVNFTMTGQWRLNLEVWKAGTMIQQTYFDVEVN